MSKDVFALFESAKVSRLQTIQLKGGRHMCCVKGGGCTGWCSGGSGCVGGGSSSYCCDDFSDCTNLAPPSGPTSGGSSSW